jgi:hypothetical protein
MTIQQISQTFNEMLTVMYTAAAAFLPRLFWAVIIAGAGWIAAWILKKITLQVVHGTDQLLATTAVQKGLHYVHIRDRWSALSGKRSTGYPCSFFSSWRYRFCSCSSFPASWKMC